MPPLDNTPQTISSLLAVPIGRLVGVLWAVFLLSCLYAVFLSWAESRFGFVSAYTWLTVVIGVAYTLAGVAVLNWQAAALALIVFAMASVPMIGRSILQDLAERAELREYLESRGSDEA